MRKTMPKIDAIWKHWQNIWSDDGDICCFACEKTFNLERCHIIPSIYGGSESLDNLHILCSSCHKQTEGMGLYNPNLYNMFLKNKQNWMTEISNIVIDNFKRNSLYK